MVLWRLGQNHPKKTEDREQCSLLRKASEGFPNPAVQYADTLAGMLHSGPFQARVGGLTGSGHKLQDEVMTEVADAEQGREREEWLNPGVLYILLHENLNTRKICYLSESSLPALEVRTALATSSDLASVLRLTIWQRTLPMTGRLRLDMI